MLPVKLSNVPRTDLPRRHADRGVHVYPFYDPKLKHKYSKLPLPESKNATKGHISHPALQKTWFDVKVTNFNSGSGRGTIPRWPFGETTVEQTPGRMPSGQGTVFLDDLGDVQSVLEEANIAIKSNDTRKKPSPCPADANSSASDGTVSVSNATVPNTDAADPDSSCEKSWTGRFRPPPQPFPTVLAPEINSIRVKQYRLDPSAELRAVLRGWHKSVVITKNEAIRRLNLIEDKKELSAYKLYEDLVNSQSPFVLEQNRTLKVPLNSCPSQTRRSAVLEAVTSRKSALTKHKKSKKEDKVADSHLTEESSSFVLTFDRACGSIAFQTHGNKRRKESKTSAGNRETSTNDSDWANPTLHMTPRILGKLKIDPYVGMRVSGKKNRQELYELLKKDDQQENIAHGDTNNKDGNDKVNDMLEHLPLPREWKIKYVSSKEIYLQIAYKVETTDPKALTVLQAGDERITGPDTGARTMITGFESPGRVIEIGDKDDAARLSKLRKEADKLKSRRLERQDEESEDEHGDDEDGEDEDGKDKDDTTRDNKDATLDSKDKTRDNDDATLDSKDKTRDNDDKDDLIDGKGNTVQDDNMVGNSNGGSKQQPFALPAKQRRRLLKIEKRILKRHRDLVKDLHCRAANYFATTSDVVVMPRMETRGMIRGKRLYKSVKQTLMAYAHCKYTDRNYVKCHDVQHDKRYKKQSILLAQPEGYTSKTCAKCGHINDQLGANKTFKCPRPDCDYVADRDHNGALNMILKAIR